MVTASLTLLTKDKSGRMKVVLKATSGALRTCRSDIVNLASAWSKEMLKDDSDRLLFMSTIQSKVDDMS